MVDEINALDCSADELLCMEIGKARPLLDGWFSELVVASIENSRKVIVTFSVLKKL